MTAAEQPWAMLTCYDALTAELLEAAGVSALLVGDTAAEVVLGFPNTLPITVDQLMTMVQAVVRGTNRALVVADMPFGSYQDGVSQALSTATRFIKEGGAQAVKLEGGASVLRQVGKLVEAGIPVMGHLGLTPQSVHVLGGVQRVQGRGVAGEQLIADALGLEAAGAFAVVLEAIPSVLGREVSTALTIPTVGIGAGPYCDAQVLVWQDMAGLTTGRSPRFVRRFGALASALTTAASEYVAAVEARAFPGESESYR